MTTLRTTTSTEFQKRVYFDGSPTYVFNEKCLTPLMKACMFGRPEQVKLILEDKPLAAIERDGVFKTALHYCAENDDEDAECAKLLLEADLSIVDIPDDDGHTALHLAVIAGNLPLVRFLLVTGRADPNKRDAEGHSTVHWATVCADVDALELVLLHGGTTSSADVHGGYAIHYAAQMCGTGICRGSAADARNVGVRILKLLLSHNADVHVTDKHGRQPILWAASAGSADAIITLVNGGANVESHDKDGLTALHCAASRGHVECVDGLITLCGSDIEAVDSNKCSALFYAVTLGHADATETLLEHGANPDRQDGMERTPAHCGAFKGQLETLRLLAEHGANLWLRNSKGGYPLHDAVRSGRKELVLWLISMRPESTDYYDDDGKRPLHIAALNNNSEMCKIMLDHGASINPVMKIKGERMTPLDVALRKNNAHLAKFLNLYGGKPASKLNKTLTKQSTVRVKSKRSETRRNSYSSDSICRKYRSGGTRKKQTTQRKNDSFKQNKTSKGRLVQVHIRADVLTKTVGNDKKPCGGAKLPRNRRKKVTAADEFKECLSENDMCHGGEGSRDFDECNYDYDYDYDEDDEDDDDDSEGRGEDKGHSTDVRLGDCGVHEKTNGLAAAAKERRHRGRRPINGRRRGDRTTDITGHEDSREQQMTAPVAAADNGRPQRDATCDQTSTVNAIRTADGQLSETPTSDGVARAASNVVPYGVHGHENSGDGAADAVDGKQRGDQLNTPGGNGRKDNYNAEKSKRSSKKADGGSVVKFIDSPEDNGEKKVENVGRSIRGTELVSRHVGGPDVVSHDKNAGDCDLMDNLGLNRRRGEGWTTTADNQIGSTAAVMVDGDMLAEKIAAERTTTVREGGKEPTGQSKKLNNRAIVQVLDSVDTPQSHFVSENCDDSGDNRPSVVEPTTAFSVLPDVAGDGGQHCNCPSCHENSSRTSSKKLKSRIPRLNKYCSLAPESDLNTMSVTRAIQLSSRKYHLERLIFYQLSELKRLQIRAGKSDERVLVKRLIEEYGKTGVFIGLKRYDGPYSFKRFEKYLYDQLLVLQKQSLAGGKSVIPRVQSIDEMEKLKGALRRIDAGKTVLERTSDCLSCTQITNRCFHATHAYTGVPCAAYIPSFRLDHHQMPKPGAGGRFLPDIRLQDSSGAIRYGGGLRNVDPSRPITLHLGNGPCTQAIDLPTDGLDKNKRYLVTFTVKDSAGSSQNARRPAEVLPAHSSTRDHELPDQANSCHTTPLAHTHAKSF